MNAFEIFNGTLFVGGTAISDATTTTEGTFANGAAMIPLANGYSVSVVFHSGTYSDDGKTTAETAVMRPDGAFLYSTLSNMVEAYQTPAQVFATMARVVNTYH